MNLLTLIQGASVTALLVAGAAAVGLYACFRPSWTLPCVLACLFALTVSATGLAAHAWLTTPVPPAHTGSAHSTTPLRGASPARLDDPRPSHRSACVPVL